MRDRNWSAEIVDVLCELKREGRSFNVAWKLALQRCPPRAIDLGLRGYGGGTLEGDLVFRTELEWHRGVMSDAWHGRRKALKHFEPTLLIAA